MVPRPGGLPPAVQAQVAGAARPFLQTADHGHLVYSVFTHLTISRPFAADHCDEAGLRNEHAVVPRHGSRVGGPSDFPQRPETGESAQDILTLWVLAQVTGGMRQKKLDLFRQRP